VVGAITYNEDLTKQAPYLRPSTANAATILAWISATCNVTGKGSFWSATTLPSVSIVDIQLKTNLTGVFGLKNTPTGPYSCGILLPSGDATFIPSLATADKAQVLYGISSQNFPGLGSFTYSTPAMTNSYKLLYGVLSPTGRIVAVSNSNPGYIVSIDVNTTVTTVPLNSPYTTGCGGCVLGPDSSVIIIPAYTSTLRAIVSYNDFTNSLTTKRTITDGTFTQDGEFAGGVLLPNGHIVFIPYSNSFICAYDPITDTFVNGSFWSTSGYNGGVLTPSGSVVCVPYSSDVTSRIGIYTPATSSTSATFTTVATNAGQYAFCGGCLLPTGNIILAPYASTNIGMFSPSTLTYTTLVNISAFHATGGPQCRGCVLRPDGKVVFVINNYTTKRILILNMNTPAPKEMCLSPFFNKF
jgi:hypothetical protein